MKTRRPAVSLFALLGCLAAECAVAENFDFETGLTLGRSSTDSINAIAIIDGNPAPGAGVIVSSRDSDTIELSGTWYYSVATDDKGPKSQAEFLSRASSLSVEYSYDDASGSFSTTGWSVPPLAITPPISGTSSSKSDSLTLRARHVWRDSGWYALGSYSALDARFKTVVDGSTFGGEASATGYSAGFGKYLGSATAVDLSVAWADQDGSNDVAVALALKHIGSLGESWQYGTDLAVISSDAAGEDLTYQLRLSLFPNREFEFGAGLRRKEADRGIDGNTYEAFASWFPSNRVQLRARYSTNDLEPFLAQDYDSDEISAGLSVRF